MEKTTAQQQQSLSLLLRQIQSTHNIDFSNYKPTSVSRRIAKRMELLGLSDYESYSDYLSAHPAEYKQLVDSLLINVSAFFRNQEVWQTIESQVIPKIAQRASDKIRIWCVGCATGEEAYTLAMLFAEQLGETVFRQRIKIYATDIDADALQKARNASYAKKSVECLPQELLEKYFNLVNDQYVFRKDLRKFIIFGEHNIIRDIPISKIHLLTCRNALIYLNADAQKQVLRRLHYALVDEGYLLLGKAETLMFNSQLFKSVNLRDRIFKKIATVQEGLHCQTGGMFSQSTSDDNRQVLQQNLLRDIVSSCREAVVVLDETSQVRLINLKAQSLFALTSKDIGRPFKDVQLSYQPWELRSQVQQVLETKKTLRLLNKVYQREQSNSLYLDIEMVPRLQSDGNICGIMIYFYDVTQQHQLDHELQETKQHLLVSRDELQSVNDELETTNEELQSTNEELETTNEELQSTNEELETSNEELQALNTELEHSNAELKQNKNLLDEYKYYNELMLDSLDLGMVSVDKQLRVIAWNEWNEKQWGLSAAEVKGTSIFDIRAGLDFKMLEQRLLHFSREDSVVSLSALNRLGKTVECLLTIYPLMKENGVEGGFILVIRDVTELKALEEKLAKNRERYNHLSRCYTMGETINELAHELGQPLSSIENYIEGLLLRLDQQETDTVVIKEVLQKVSSVSHHASDVIKRVRGFIKKQKIEFSWVKVSELIDTAVDFFQEVIKSRKITLTQYIDPDLKEVFVDKLRVNQVLVNLLKNAIDAISEYPEDLRHIIIRAQRSEGANFVIYLDNTGPQFSQIEVDKMFDHYYTTKHTGVGLGLSISRSIMSACGGTLSAKPREAGGVSFALLLPEISKNTK